MSKTQQPYDCVLLQTVQAVRSSWGVNGCLLRSREKGQVLQPWISALSQLLPKSMQIVKANSKRADKTLAAGQDVHLLGSVHNPRALGHRLISHVAHPFTDPLEVLHLRVPLVI